MKRLDTAHDGAITAQGAAKWSQVVLPFPSLLLLSSKPPAGACATGFLHLRLHLDHGSPHAPRETSMCPVPRQYTCLVDGSRAASPPRPRSPPPRAPCPPGAAPRSADGRRDTTSITSRGEAVPHPGGFIHQRDLAAPLIVRRRGAVFPPSPGTRPPPPTWRAGAWEHGRPRRGR